MTWYFNYCAPVLPNDPTINFHRYFQCGALILVYILYICLHIYYQMCGPQPLEEHQVEQNVGQSQEESDSDKGLQHNVENSDEKSISINSGINRDQNQSYITFASKPAEWNRSQKPKQEKKKKVNYEIVQNVTISEVQGFFSIVVGHYSLAVAISILYSPYFQQSIGTIIYLILAIILIIFNSKRVKNGVYIVWGLMCTIIIFLITSATLQIGQTQWNPIKKQCFALDYKPLF